VSHNQDKLFLKRFGGNVRRIRVEKGISQEKLAELADLNIRSVQRIEAGEITVLITTAHRLQKALRVKWDALCDG